MSLPIEYANYLHKELNPAERFGDLFSGKDDRQDFTNILLYEVLKALTNGSPAGGSNGSNDGYPSNGDGNTGVPNVLINAGIKTVKLIGNVASVSTGIINPQRMADCRKAIRVTILVNNGLDQDTRLDVIGNDADNYSGGLVISSKNIPANERLAYGLKIEEWMPYISCTLTPLVAPTAGNVYAVAIVQELMPAEV